MPTRFCVLAALASTSLLGDHRGPLLNPWAVHNEIRVDRSASASVKTFFPSFCEYQNLVLYHPKFGYYSSGRVDFVNDFRTFPSALYPYFGHMIAEQIFRMWDGMRKAGAPGTLDKRFTIAEFGGGDGALAESILDYVDQQAGKDPERWQQFSRQLIYASYDRSPAMSDQQRKRNARFGSRFEAREGDAINPTIPPGSLTGVVLSNELPDTFGVHKVLFSVDGSAEIAFVAPSLSRVGWSLIERDLPEGVKQRLLAKDLMIRKKLFRSQLAGTIFLSREGLTSVLEAIAHGADNSSKLEALEFHEVYLPAGTVPEVAAHIRKYAQDYAVQVARGGRSLVTYINLDEGQFLRKAGQMLKTGYVLTIDYGGNWNTVSDVDVEHLRAFGPGRNAKEEANPYYWPTLNDLTSDVNFSHMSDEGKESRLEPVFFGPQVNLLLGTDLRLEEVPETSSESFFEWVLNFFNWRAYKVLIERKVGTDPAYVFPRSGSEPLQVDLKTLSPQQQTLSQKIRDRLRGQGL
jgi:SAM-dependent MidA family methyltransferase